MKKLLVLAGPTCAGKSWLIESLKHGSAGPLSESLDLSEMEDWISYPANRLPDISQIDKNNVIVEYALPVGKLKDESLHDFATEPRLKLLKDAEDIAFATVIIDKDTLRDHINSRRRRLLRDLLKLNNPKRILREHRRLTRLSHLLEKDPSLLARVYKQWFEYCKNHKSARRYVVNMQSITHS